MHQLQHRNRLRPGQVEVMLCQQSADRLQAVAAAELVAGGLLESTRADNLDGLTVESVQLWPRQRPSRIVEQKGLMGRKMGRLS